jgi:hypothetical protein
MTAVPVEDRVEMSTVALRAANAHFFVVEALVEDRVEVLVEGARG